MYHIIEDGILMFPVMSLCKWMLTEAHWCLGVNRIAVVSASIIGLRCWLRRHLYVTCAVIVLECN